MTPRWIRLAGSELPQRWAFKKDVPAQWRDRARRVRFNFETAWIVRDHAGKVWMPGGGWADCFEFYLRTPGHVLGLRDLTTADQQDWAEEWRAAGHDQIKLEIEMRLAARMN